MKREEVELLIKYTNIQIRTYANSLYEYAKLLEEDDQFTNALARVEESIKLGCTEEGIINFKNQIEELIKASKEESRKVSRKLFEDQDNSEDEDSDASEPIFSGPDPDEYVFDNFALLPERRTIAQKSFKIATEAIGNNDIDSALSWFEQANYFSNPATEMSSHADEDLAHYLDENLQNFPLEKIKNLIQCLKDAPYKDLTCTNIQNLEAEYKSLSKTSRKRDAEEMKSDDEHNSKRSPIEDDGAAAAEKPSDVDSLGEVSPLPETDGA